MLHDEPEAGQAGGLKQAEPGSGPVKDGRIDVSKAERL
jgi:hypothetical protein